MNDKKTLHDSLRHNQLFCPKAKEAIMTVHFMKGCIGYKRYWLPKTEDIRIRNCVDPPSRVEVAKLVHKLMLKSEPSGNASFDAAFKATAHEILGKPPNVEWLLAMVSTMEPTNALFAKDYVKPRIVRNADFERDTDMVDNADGWFDGLPLAKRKRGAPLSMISTAGA